MPAIMVENYALLFEDGYGYVSLRDAIIFAKDHGEYFWSVRLGTGLLGNVDCVSGRAGPSGTNEVLLAMGDGGLRRIVELGFITCPTCHPEQVQGFWPAVESVVREKYGIGELRDFIDKRVLPPDARRLDWEKIISIVGGMPSRLYVPQGLCTHDVSALQKRFDRLGVPVPAVGWYDRDAPDRFCEYQLSAGR